MFAKKQKQNQQCPGVFGDYTAFLKNKLYICDLFVFRLRENVRLQKEQMFGAEFNRQGREVRK